MRLECLIETSAERPLALDDEALEGLARAVLEAEGVAQPVELSVSVVDDGAMASLNAKLRGIDEPTDVLSVEIERPGETASPDEPCMLGDLVLAPSFIAAQAERFGVGEAEETALLVIHGLLHLLGYDHVEPEGARVMEARQNELVARHTGGAMEGVRLLVDEGEREP